MNKEVIIDIENPKDNDLISRQAVLDIDFNRIIHTTAKPVEMIKQKIEQLPSVKTQETKWIPVSEGLPKDIKPVIVTWKNTDPEPYYQHIVGKHFVGTAHYNGSRWFWYSSVTEDMLAEYGQCITEEFCEGIEVIAWMPLPKPYLPDTNIGNMSENPTGSKPEISSYYGLRSYVRERSE